MLTLLIIKIIIINTKKQEVFMNNIKEKIEDSKIDRRELAKHLGMSYQSLCARLNEFTPWQRGELDKVDKFVEANLIRG